MWKLLFYKEFHLSWKNILRAFPYLIYWLYLEFALLTCTLPFVYTLNPAGQQEIRLTLHLTDENFSQVEIVFYRYDGSNCLATVDGDSFALVSRSSVVDLMEAVNAIVLS